MTKIDDKMRAVFSLETIQNHMRIRADACRRLASQEPEGSLAARNWSGLADELDSEVHALQFHIERPKWPSEAQLEGLKDYVIWHGGAHTEDCPGDDTCECAGKPLNDAVNSILREAFDRALK
jgi:hypothetical protein